MKTLDLKKLDKNKSTCLVDIIKQWEQHEYNIVIESYLILLDRNDIVIANVCREKFKNFALSKGSEGKTVLLDSLSSQLFSCYNTYQVKERIDSVFDTTSSNLNSLATVAPSKTLGSISSILIVISTILSCLLLIYLMNKAHRYDLNFSYLGWVLVMIVAVILVSRKVIYLYDNFIDYLQGKLDRKKFNSILSSAALIYVVLFFLLVISLAVAIGNGRPESLILILIILFIVPQVVLYFKIRKYLKTINL